MTPTNAAALCTALGDGSVKVLARRGDLVGGKTIATLGTLGEGRWRVDETTCGVRLTFDDAVKTQAVDAIPGTAPSSADWILLAQTGVVNNVAAINGTTINTLGLPGFGPGATAAVIATDANGTAITGVKIARFFDPIAGAGRQTAFAVNAMRGTQRIAGIMISENGDAPSLLANVGAAAPGSGHWASLGALVFPDGVANGPIFAGTVAVRGSAPSEPGFNHSDSPTLRQTHPSPACLCCRRSSGGRWGS